MLFINDRLADLPSAAWQRRVLWDHPAMNERLKSSLQSIEGAWRRTWGGNALHNIKRYREMELGLRRTLPNWTGVLRDRLKSFRRRRCRQWDQGPRRRCSVTVSLTLL